MKNILRFPSKTIILLSLVLCQAACKKSDSMTKAPLTQVTLEGKIYESFEYDTQNRLLKENHYSICDSNPMDEYFYTYKNNRLEKVKTITRVIYSSLNAICDPTTGLHSEETFTYDNAGRISHVNRPNSVTEYVYNQAGFVKKKILKDATNELVWEYEFDNRGNVLKETDSQGLITEYEYDNKKNPYYYIKSRPGNTTAFTMSPNNVIKGKGSRNFVRKFQYNADGLPSRVEDNGQSYVYIYK